MEAITRDNLTTPWCRVLLQKLLLFQLVKEFLTFLRNPKLHYCIQKSLPLATILGQITSFHILTSCFCKLHFNIILLSKRRYAIGFFLSGFPAKLLYAFLISPMRSTRLAHLILLHFIILITSDETYRLCSLL